MVRKPLPKVKDVAESPADFDYDPKQSKPAPAPKKQKMTFHLTAALIERLRDASFWTPGGYPSGLVEAAVEAYIAKLEKQRGEPFPPRRGELPKGRPVK